MWKATRGNRATILKSENILSVYKEAGYTITEIKGKVEPVKDEKPADETKKTTTEKPSRTDIMKMNKKQLIALAKERGIEVDEDATNQVLQKALLEE